MSDQVLDEYLAALLAAQNPDYFLPEQFCANGVNLIDYIVPPVTSSDPKVASLSAGAPPLQQVKPIDGGAAFPRQEYNGILRVLSNMLSFLNKGGEFTFNVNNTAGYSINSVLYDYTSKRYVVSLKDNNTANFVTNPTLINNVDWAFLTITPAMLNSYALLSGAAFSGDISVKNFPTKGLGIVASGSNANGSWIKYANGLIQQWGIATVPANIGYMTVTFPIPFTSTPTGMLLSSNVSSAIFHTHQQVTASTFTLQAWSSVSGAPPVSMASASWLAAGY